MRKWLFRITVIASAFLIVASPALANDQFYSWTMNLRVVNPHGGPLHHMNAGNLLNTGQIWPYSTDPGHTTSPVTVFISVYPEGDDGHNPVCTGSITPNTTFNVGKQYNFNCPFINTGNYWVQIYKGIDDGWNEQGQGDLIT